MLNDKNLKNRVHEFSKLTTSKEDQKIFNYVTEFLVISNVAGKGIKRFEYEEKLDEKACCFDINITYNHMRLRIDVTHKTDSYPLENTVEILKNNISFISNKIGGEIKYAYPGTIDYNFTDVNKINMDYKQIKESVTVAYQKILNSNEKSFKIPLSNEYFEIYVDYDLNSFLGKPCYELWEKAERNGFIDNPIGSSKESAVETYFNSLSKKAIKYKKIRNDSYKIIAFDINPSSYFHNGDRRQELSKRIEEFYNRNKFNIDEIVTFSMRFENRILENLNLLWSKNRDQESKLIRFLKD